MTDTVENLRVDVEELLAVQDESTSSKGSKKKVNMNWGFPGHLTRAEGDIFVKFRDEVDKRGGEFRNTVYSFTEEEGEAYCLTRWLRARKYVYDDVIKMVEEATECRAEPREHDYYPNATESLGVEPAIFQSQYPQLYSGFSKTGCPVFYSKPGQLEIDGLECITTAQGILNYHWHVMQHDYKNRLLGFKKENPDFKRFECVTVLDLANVTVGKLGSRTLDIIKIQSHVDSLCFPETMNKTVIVNAPRFFSMTWGLIKGWLDQRTVNKIELFSNSSAAQKKLKEIIDEDQIPSDYGGTAEDTKTTEKRVASEECGVKYLWTNLLSVRSSASCNLNIQNDEEVDFHVYTKSTSGATLTLSDASNRSTLMTPKEGLKVARKEGSDEPNSEHLTKILGRISGPKNVKIKAVGEGMFSTDFFLIVGKVYKK